MLRTRKVMAGTVALVAVLGGAAIAEEPVDTIVAAVEDATGVDLPKVDTGPVVVEPGGGVGGVGRGVRGRSAVVGYIQIIASAEAGTTHTLVGALADPNEWTCSGGGGGGSYTVSCKPVALPVVMDYHCDVLHADAQGMSETGSVRTSMDCDGDGAPESQTILAQGLTGYDFKWSVDTRLVTAFTCTADNLVPDARAGCGDPGFVGVSL